MVADVKNNDVIASADRAGATMEARATMGKVNRRRVPSAASALLGGFGLVALLASQASAQDNVDAELEALEAGAGESALQDTAEAPVAEAPAAEAPAAEAPAAEPAAGAPPAAADDVDEVVVTVDRRRKSLQDYSGVAAAFSESKLQSVGVTNVRDLAQMVPGLQIGVQEGNAEVYIRGIGSDNNTELGDPAVALHLDGVYVPRPRGVGSMFFDIERVEVSSGPQGTLRGRNAMGGTVNVVSKQPVLGEYQANAQATFGTFNQRRYQGMVNVPLGDTVAFRAAGFSEVRDSFWENAGNVYDIDSGESANAWAVRAQLKYEPTARFTALAAFDMTREMGTPYLGANFQGPLTATDGEGGPVVPFEPNDVSNPRRTYLRGMNPASNLDHMGARLTLSYDTGPAVIEAIGSFRRMEFQQNTGANAGVVYEGYDYDQNTDVYGNGFWDTASDSYIAELRAYAPDTARARWTVGGFLFNERQDAFLGQVSDPANFFGGGEFNMPGVTGVSGAGYGDVTFDVTSDLRLIAGVRVTYDQRKRRDGLWSLFNGFPAPNDALGGDVRYGTEGFRYEAYDRGQYRLPSNYSSLSRGEQLTERVNMFLAGVESFGGRDTLPLYLCNDPTMGADGEMGPRLEPNQNAGSGWQCANGVNQGLLPDDPNNPGPFQFVRQSNAVNNTFFDWRAGAEYDLSKDSMLYATASTGHKSGGFNDTAPNPTPENADAVFDDQYGPENVLAFEIGSKNMLANRRLRLNAAAFAYIYEDYVFQTIQTFGEPNPDDPDAQPPSSARRQNAANANLYGLDLDVNYRLPLGLEAEAHVLLMDAKFGSGTQVSDTRIGFGPNDPYQVGIDGNWLPRASPFTVNFALSQLVYTSIGSFNWSVQGQTRGKHYMTVYNGEGNVSDPAGDEPSRTNDDGNLTAYGQLTNPDDPNSAQRLTDVVPTYTRFDLGAGWKHPDGRIAINGYVNNLTNIAYATSIISTPGLNLRFFNPPRQAGVRVRVDW